ncbi:fatty acid synthase-like [Bacillus rossius redtenbacheri]|uniref:fatty acid synthase-like n=1 Tax=Bacillus rossius redtenbacheri TaxID=93214 RepID=UPI002FDE4E64
MGDARAAGADPQDVVISGMAGVFPQCDSVDELGARLLDNSSLTEEVEDRTGFRESNGLPKLHGVVQDKDKFDTTFFGISHAQTFRMDSLTWRILEKTYEAIVDSGNNPAALRNSRTAIIIGCFVSESESLWLEHGQAEGGFSIVGHNRSMLSNRVSYWLNTKGPSYASYSEELAGLSGLAQAHELISSGECDAALVGTIDMMTRAELLYAYHGLGKESLRSNACVVLYLQRARDAKRVYATVAHADYDYCGSRDSGLVRPSSQHIEGLLRRFYQRCPVQPAQLGYLELSCCGIKAHEEAEARAVDAVLLGQRSAPLLAGCVKSNMGNSNVSAAMCAIAKILVAMEKRVIPATLEYRPSSPLAESRLQVVTENTPWEPTYAAVSNIDSFGGCGHAVLRANTKKRPASGGDDLPRLVCLSGRHEEKMRLSLDKLSAMPADKEFVRLVHDVHSVNISNHNYRGYVIAPSENSVAEVQHFDGSKRPVWFVFSGMGSQWAGMATHLMRLPVIARTLHECHRILQPKGLDLINILTSQDPAVFDNILHSFVGIAAVQLALVDTLRLLNIEPDGIIGHSVGELGCAYADGCFTLEQMILAAYYRGLASLETELIEGRMAAIGLGYGKVKTLVPPTVDVACHNSEDSSTISGPSEDISRFVEELKSGGTFAREVNVSGIAYHSRYIASAAPKLLEYLKQVIPEPKQRSPRWLSTSAPEELWSTDEARYSSAQYHTNNLLNPVLFEETSKHIPKNAILIEIAPHGLLQAILKRSMAADCINVPLTQRGNQKGLEFLLSAIGKIYLAGKEPLLSALYPPVQFPVSQGTPSIASLTTWDHSKIWRIPDTLYIEKKLSLNHYITISLNEGKYQLLKEYRLNGEIILPVSVILMKVWELVGSRHSRDFMKIPVMFEKIFAPKPLVFPENESISLHLTILQTTGKFEVSEFHKNRIFLKGRVMLMNDIAQESAAEISSQTEHMKELTASDIYGGLERKGYEPGEMFKKICRMELSDNGSTAVVDRSDDWGVFVESLLQLAVFHANEGQQKLQFPRHIESLLINPLQPVSSEDCVAVFNKFTRSVCCGGVKITGIRTEELDKDSRINVISHRLRFVPYLKTQYQNAREFVDTAVQLLMENVGSFRRSTLKMTEIVNGLPVNLGTEVRNAVSSYHKDKVALNAISTDEVQSAGDAALGSTLLATGSTVREALALLETRGSFLLARLDRGEQPALGASVAVVAEQHFGSTRWLVLKKCVPVNEKSTVIYLPQLPTVEFSETLVTNGSSRYYFVADTSSLEEVKELLSRATAQIKTNLKSCRFVFLMDRQAPPFSLSDQFYTKQLSLDLVVNIYCNKAWGSLRHLEASPQSAAGRNDLHRLTAALGFDDFEWSCVGINLKNLSKGKQDDISLGVVEVSGRTPDGRRVMCLARLEPGNARLTMEPRLMWPVPETWSLEDAATVPLAYVMAYYSLGLKARIGNSLLVLPGNLLLEQTYVAVALHLGLEVCVAVLDDRHRHFFRGKFPQLQDSNIKDFREKNFAVKLLQSRNGSGFHNIVNLSDDLPLRMVTSLVCSYGNILQLTRTAMEQNQEFGMAPFLDAISLNGIIPELFFEMHDTWKQQLHDAVAEGIEAGVVLPFDKQLFTFSQEKEIFKTLCDGDFVGKVVITKKKNHKYQVKNSAPEWKENDTRPSFVIDSRNSCLIVGDELADCVDLAEWLVDRGCRHLAVWCRERAVSSLTRRRLHLLRTQHRAHVAVSPLEASRILQDSAGTPEPLAAVFMLPVRDAELVSLLDVVLGDRSVQRYVLLMHGAAHGAAGARRRRGLPVLDVQWDGRHGAASLRHVLRELDELLARMPGDTVYLSVPNNCTADKASSGNQLPMLLPGSLGELAALGEDLASRGACSLEETCTRSPRTAHVREMHPVFLVPGLQGPASGLGRLLACPAVLVHAPRGTAAAAAVAQDMRELQRGGVYNIVGVSWGGVYALEIARQLQAVGEKTRMFLVDGVPQTNQAIARLLGEGAQLQVNLLATLLNITSSQVRDALTQLPDWDARLRRALAELPPSQQSSKENIRCAIESIYSRVNTLLSYQPCGTLLDGEATLILSNVIADSDREIQKCFKNEVNMVLVDGNRRTLAESRETASIISENIAVDLYWSRDNIPSAVRCS